MRGPIPDKAIGRPTVQEVVKLVKAYYKMPGNGCGGNLHVVLDDGNMEDNSIQYCLGHAEKAHDLPGIKIAEMLLEMTRTQRNKVYAIGGY